jgi:hypothetical protein
MTLGIEETPHRRSLAGWGPPCAGTPRNPTLMVLRSGRGDNARRLC